MKVNEIISNPLHSLQYMERYVNIGSPSGFSKSTTSYETSPVGTIPFFYLYRCDVEMESAYNFGKLPAFMQDGNWIFLHPDVMPYLKEKYKNLRISEYKEMKVVPTASGRTVQIFDKEPHDYIKLHYNLILGRFSRSLPMKKAVAGPEISRILHVALENDKFPPKFYFFPETGCRVVKAISPDGSSEEIGMIWRSNKIIGKNPEKIRAVIPFFSLFSPDLYETQDALILIQILNNVAGDPLDYIFENLLFPLIEIYFSMVAHLGIQPEWNAQNLCVGLSEDGNINSVIMRDLGESDKDITLRKLLNLSCEFLSYPYKCINDGSNEYRQRHSFMFDFKFGEYVLQPILDVLINVFGYRESMLIKIIKDFTKQFADILPDDFFPADGKWYKFEQVIFSDRYYYVPVDSPKFR